MVENLCGGLSKSPSRKKTTVKKKHKKVRDEEGNIYIYDVMHYEAFQ